MVIFNRSTIREGLCVATSLPSAPQNNKYQIVNKRSETHTKRGEKCSFTEKPSFEFLTFIYENTWQPKTIWSCSIKKRLVLFF
jgi:hypothetical protein